MSHLHVPASEWHLQIICEHEVSQDQHSTSGYSCAEVFSGYNLSYIMYCDVYFRIFYLVHVLVNIPNIIKCTVGVTCMYVCRFQNVVLRCPTPRLHCFLSSHLPSFRFLSSVAFLIPSIQFFFGLPRALFCFGIHFNAILGNLPSAILWTWLYHVSWFCSISFIIGSSNPICCLIVTFLILYFSWYSRGSPQGIHLCSFDPSFIIFCESPSFATTQ